MRSLMGPGAVHAAPGSLPSAERPRPSWPPSSEGRRPDAKKQLLLSDEVNEERAAAFHDEAAEGPEARPVDVLRVRGRLRACRHSFLRSTAASVLSRISRTHPEAS